MRDQLRGVQRMQSTEAAFAAINENGSTVTWGDPDCSGDSSEVQDQLKNARQIQATEAAFAAVLKTALPSLGARQISAVTALRSKIS